jgi:hypothetical protein
MKKKLELDIEGQVLKVETIAHQRALKLLSEGLFKIQSRKAGQSAFPGEPPWQGWRL